MDLQSQVEPDSTNNANATIAARPAKPWKLRQTCDLCSEAKVKCDKAKPGCGRCDRLSFECVYSPARRIGRPRPRSQEQDTAQDSARAARDDTMVMQLDETKKDYTTSAPAPTSAPGSASLPASARPADMDLSLNEPLMDDFSDDMAVDHLNNNTNTINNNHDPFEYDCATVAIATLSKLAATGLDGHSQSQQSGATTATAADVLTDHIPHACRQAARILVCPCSADMDVALLVASLAAAILEVADAALRILKPAGHALDDEQRTVLALDTLPNISRVVTLFTHRYSVTQASHPPDALLLLAASLRTTLKTVAEETTSRLLDSGAAPSRVQVAANVLGQ